MRVWTLGAAGSVNLQGLQERAPEPAAAREAGVRRFGRVDGNHEAIVDALRRSGWKVVSLANVGGGVPDLLVYRTGQPIRLLEVKAKGGTITRMQEEFMAAGWPVTIVRSVEDVLGL